jgi:RNA polymerase sigma-70 factor, ECF subfamily
VSQVNVSNAIDLQQSAARLRNPAQALDQALRLALRHSTTQPAVAVRNAPMFASEIDLTPDQTAPIVVKRPARHRSPAVSDEALIERIAQGNDLALQMLFARHHDRIRCFVLRLVKRHSLAQDLTSDVFLEVWQQAGRFRADSAVTTWLLGIAKFKALTQLRKRAEEPLDEEAAEEMADEACDPERALATKERSAILRQCLTQLSTEHRRVVDLVYYHEKTIVEVARITGVPTATAKSRAFYARKRVADLLAAHSVDQDWLR